MGEIYKTKLNTYCNMDSMNVQLGLVFCTDCRHRIDLYFVIRDFGTKSYEKHLRGEGTVGG